MSQLPYVSHLHTYVPMRILYTHMFTNFVSVKAETSSASPRTYMQHYEK